MTEDLLYLSDSFIHLTNDRTDLSSLNNDKENTFKLEMLSKKLDGMNNNKPVNDKISLHSTPLVGRKIMQMLNDNISQETYELSENSNDTGTLEQDSMIGLKRKEREPAALEEDASVDSTGADVELRDSRSANYDRLMDNMTQNQLQGNSVKSGQFNGNNEQYSQSTGRNSQFGGFDGNTEQYNHSNERNSQFGEFNANKEQYSQFGQFSGNNDQYKSQERNNQFSQLNKQYNQSTGRNNQSGQYNEHYNQSNDRNNHLDDFNSNKEQYNQYNKINGHFGANGLGKDLSDSHSTQVNQRIPNNSKDQIHSNQKSNQYHNQVHLDSNSNPPVNRYYNQSHFDSNSNQQSKQYHNKVHYSNSNQHSNQYHNQVHSDSKSKAKQNLQSYNLQGSSKDLNIKIIKLIKQLNPLLSQKILSNLFKSIESLLVEGLDDIVLEQTTTLKTPPNSNLPCKIKPSTPELSNLDEFEKSPSPSPRIRYEVPKTPVSFEAPNVQESNPSTAETKIPSLPHSQDSSSIEQLKQQISQLTKQNNSLQLENIDLNVKINHLNQQILSDDDFKLDDTNQNNLQETIKLKSEIKQLESKLFRSTQAYQELKNEFIWSKNNSQRSKVEENEDANEDQPEVKQNNSNQPVDQSDNHQDGSLLNKQVIDAISQSYQSQLKAKDDEIERLSKTLQQEVGDKSKILDESKIPEKFNRKYHELQLNILDSKSKVELINIIKQIMLSLLITNVDDLSVNMNKYGNYLKLSVQFLDKLHDLMYNSKDTIKPSYYIRNQTGFDQDLSQLRQCLLGMIDEVGNKVSK